MFPNDEHVDAPKVPLSHGGVLKRRIGFLLAVTFCTLLISATTDGQVPILYYDFENNTTRTTFENLVEQAVNAGSSAIARAGNTTTISAVAGAGTFNGGSATGQAATGSNWDSSTADAGSAATNYYQFVVNTSGFSQLSITFDHQASATGPARLGVLYSTDGINFTATTATLTGNAVFSAATFDLSGISAIDNQSSVTIRLYAFAGSAADRIGRSAFASSGTFRIDNLSVLAKTVTAFKMLLDYPAIGLSIKSGTAFIPTYADFTVNGSGVAVALASELRVSGAFTVSNGTLTCGTNIVSGAGTFTLASGATLAIGSTVGISSSGATGNIQTNTRNFDTAANYNYNGASPQNTGSGLPSIVDNLTINNSAGVSLSSSVNVNTALVLTSGTFTVGAHTLTLNNPIAGTATNLSADSTSSVTIAGSASGINIPGSISALNNLTLSNSIGTTLQGNLTVGGTLGLTTGDLTTESFTLFMGNGSASSGNGDVLGNVNRADLSGATTRSFGNPNVQITITAGTVTAMTVNLIKASPSDFGNSARRTYTLKDVVGTLVTATVRLHYVDSELNGNAEGILELWRKDGSNWVSQGATTRDSTDNWLEKTLITGFSHWTIAGPAGPTYVAMVGYSANHDRDGKVLLQWETGEEVNNLGFNIYREDEGRRTRINKSLILGSGLMAKPGTVMTAGRAYLWQVSGAKGTDSAYWIEEIDLNGSNVWHGPIFSRRSPDGMMTMSASQQAVADQTVTLEDLATEGAQSGVTLPVPISTGSARATTARMSLQLGLASQDAITITVKQEGWYRIGKPELVSAGLNPRADARSLQLYADGAEVPITITPDPLRFDSTSAIEFYAVGLDTPSTDQRVYWLISAKTAGKRIATVAGGGGLAAANSFLSTVERRDRVLYLSGVHNGDAENFFGTPVGSASVDQIVTLRHLDSSAAGQATLEVGMQGFSLTPHNVTVSLNGNPLGTMRYDGATRGVMQFTVPNNLLSEGQNVVSLAGQQGVVDVSAVEHIRMSYWRAYSADANALKFTALANQQVTIDGFTSGDVRVLDVTDPTEPSLIAASVDQQNSGYAVTFGASGTGERTLVAFGGDQVKSPLRLAANQASTWRSATNQADLVIITHSSLRDSFAHLAALRQSQGLKVAMVDVEDIYDEFNFGNKSPQAVKDLLSYANSNWSGWRASLLTTADALALTNAGRYPLFVLMTCLNGEFQHPELNTLATGLMNAQQGGAIAVWASSGLTEPPPQAIMNQRFYNLLFQPDRQGHWPRLGDATIRAKSAIDDPDVRRTWILFGDPSMRLR